MKKALFLSLLALLVGCEDSTLETGYAPKKLTDNANARQSYYAAPYSPNAEKSGSTTVDPGLRSPGQY